MAPSAFSSGFRLIARDFSEVVSIFFIGLSLLIPTALLADIPLPKTGSPLNYVVSDEIAPATWLLDKKGISVKSFPTYPQKTDTTQDLLTYKIITANIASDATLQNHRWIKALSPKSGDLSIGGQKDDAASNPAPLPFKLLDGFSCLTNTTQNSLSWENPTENSSQIAYQQVLKQVTDNIWEVIADEIETKANSITITTKGGMYVVRKITADGAFLDSDGESSQGALGNPAFVKSYQVDTMPPEFTTTPQIQTLVDGQGRDYQTICFGLSEGGELIWTVTDNKQSTFNTMTQTVSTGSVQFTWDGRSNDGTYQDGNYDVLFYVMDKAGNRSRAVTANIVYDTFPPAITATQNLEHRFFSPNGDEKNDTLTYTFTFSEPVTGRYKLSNSAGVLFKEIPISSDVTENTLTLTSDMIGTQKDGYYQGGLQVWDNKQHLTSTTFNFTVDRESPKITLNGLPVRSLASPVSILRYSLSEPASVTLSIQNSVITGNAGANENTIELQIDNLEDGEYNAILTATDVADNTATVGVVVLIDRTPPMVQEFTLSDKINLMAPAILKLEGADNLSATLSIKAQLGGIDLPDLSLGDTDLSPIILSNPAFPDGLYTLSLTMTDKAGNSTDVTKSVTLAQHPVTIFCPDIGPVSFLIHPEYAIHYTLLNPGLTAARSIDISLIDSNGHPIQSLYHGENEPLGEKKAAFNNQSLADGIYTIALGIISDVGIVSSLNTKLDIDHLPPQIQDVSIAHTPFNYTGDPIRISAGLADRTGEFGQASVLYENIVVAQIPTLNASTITLPFNGLINGQRLPDGSHSFTLTATDKAGNESRQSLRIDIDTMAPKVLDFSASSPVLQPDSAVSDVQFQFKSDEVSTAKIDIRHSTGVMARTLATSDTGLMGTLSWDGTWDNRAIKNGDYAAQLILTDRAGNHTTSPIIPIKVQHAPSVSGLGFSSPKLSANHPFTISFQTSSSGNITATIEDVHGSSLRTLAQNKPVIAGENKLGWDGHDNAGNMVRDGEYTLSLHFTDYYVITANSIIKKSIEVDSTPPLITELSPASALLSYPTSGPLTITFKVAEAASANIALLTEIGQPISRIRQFVTEKGLNTIVWDGKNVQKDLEAGRYLLKLSVTDSADNDTAQTIPLTVKPKNPLSITSDKAAYVFTPNGDAINETAQILLTTTGTGTQNISATLRNDGGKPLVTLLNKEPISGGTVKVDWNGRDDKQLPQKTGAYTLIATLTDSLGTTLTKEIPVYLVTETIKVSLKDNGPSFSFNQDGVKDQLSYSLTLAYPSLLLDKPGYNPEVKLKAEIYQGATLVKQDLLVIKNNYDALFSGTGLAEGDFRLIISGEDSEQIPVQTVSATYNNDVTVPDTIQIAAVYQTGTAPITRSLTDPATPWMVNTQNVSAQFIAANAVTLDLMDSHQAVLTTLTNSNGIFDIAFPSSKEGINTYFYRSSDSAGNQSQVQSLSYIVDTTAPKLVSATLVSGTQALSASSVKAGQYTIWLEFSELLNPLDNPTVQLISGDTVIQSQTKGYAGTRYEGSLDIPLSARNGMSQLKISNITDLAQNKVNITSTLNYIVDTLAPTPPQLNLGASLTNATTYTDTIQAENQAFVRIFVDGSLVSRYISQGHDTVSVTLNEGTHVLTLDAEDEAGNISALSRQTIVVDLTPPRIETDSIAEKYRLKSGSYPVSITFSEGLKASRLPTVSLVSSQNRIIATGVLITKNMLTATVSIPSFTQNSDYYLEVSDVSDSAGNTIKLTASTSYSIDTTPPVYPSFILAPERIKTTLYSDTIQSESGTTLWIEVDGTALENRKSSGSDAFGHSLSEGIHTITIVSEDSAGNRSATSSYSVSVDRTPPTVSRISIDGKSVLKAGRYPVDIIFSEPLDSAKPPKISLVGTASVLPLSQIAVQDTRLTGILEVITANINGDYHFEFTTITDLAQNTISLVSSSSFTLDTLAPTVSLLSPGPVKLTRTSYDNTLQLSEADLAVTVYVDAVPAREFYHLSGPTNFNISLPEGPHTLSIDARDPAGNLSAPVSQTVLVDLTNPALTGVTLSQDSPVTAGTYTISLSFSEVIRPTLNMTVKTPGRTIPLTYNAQTQSATVTFTPGDDGQSIVEISQISDEAGNKLEAQTIPGFLVDTLRPAAPIFTQTPATVNKALYQNQVSSETGTTVRWYVDSLLAATGVTHFSQLLSEGRHTLSAESVDAAGNRSDLSNHILTVDLTRPYVTGQTLGTSEPVSANTYPVSLIYSEPVSGAQVMVRTARGMIRPVIDGKVTVELGDDGQSMLKVSGAQDSAGNTLIPYSSPAYFIDTETPHAPALDMTIPLINTSLYQNNIMAEIGSLVTIYVDERPISTLNQQSLREPFSLFLSEGTHQIMAIATDPAGNRSQSMVSATEVDLTGLSITDFTMSTPSPVSANTMAFTITYSEAVNELEAPAISIHTAQGQARSIIWDRFSGKETAGHVTFLPGDDGQSILSVTRVLDVAGNAITPVTVNAFWVDTIAPNPPTFTHTISLTSFLQYDNQVSAEPGTRIEWYVDSILVATGHSSLSTPLTEGLHTISVDTIDAAGNRSPQTSHTITVDLTPPTVSNIIFETSSPVSANTYDVNVIFSEAVSQNHLIVRTAKGDIRPIINGTVTFQSGDDGPSKIEVSGATDAAGNRMTPYMRPAYLVDTTPPNAPTLAQAPLLTRQAVYENHAEAEPGTTIQWYVDSQKATTGPDFATPLTQGIHVISADTMDHAGNNSLKTSHTLTVDLTNPHVTGFEIGTSEPVSANTYSVSVTYSELVIGAHLHIRTAQNDLRPIIDGVVTFLSGDDGQSTLEVSGGEDAAGNPLVEFSAPAYLVDSTRPPAPQFIQSITLTNQAFYQNQVQSEAGSIVHWYVDSVLAVKDQDHLATVLTEGPHIIAADTVDQAGNRSEQSRQPIVVDLTSPIVKEVRLATPEPVSANTYAIEISYSEPVTESHIQVRTAAGAIRPVSGGEVTFLRGDDGLSNIEISGARDEAGNLITPYSAPAYLIDTTAPLPPILTGSELGNNSEYPLKINAEPGTTITPYIDGIAMTPYIQYHSQETIPLTLAEGPHTLSAKITDAAGNIAVSQGLPISIDLTRPTLHSISIGGLTHLKAGTYPISLQFSEPLDTVSPYTITMKSATQNLIAQGNTITINPGDDGRYTIEIQNVTDMAGNKATLTYSTIFIVDTTKPIISADLQGAFKSNTSIYINTLGLSEPNLSVTLSVDGASIQTWHNRSESIPLSFELSEGTHTLSAVAQDLAGNISQIFTQSVIIDLTKPIITTVTLSQNSPVKAGTYTATFEFSEPVRPTLNLTLRTPARLTPLTYDANTKTAPITFISGDDGPSQIDISDVTDLAGNTIPLQSLTAFYVDTLAPKVMEKTLISDLPNASGGRDVSLRVRLSESVPAQLNLQLPDQNQLSGNLNDSIVHFQVPKNIDGQARLSISGLIDSAGNTAPDDADLDFPIDSVDPQILTIDSAASTNRGTVSALHVTGTFSEPVQTDPLHLTLLYQDGTTLQPDSLTYSTDRRSFTALFSVKPVEETLRLKWTTLKDDRDNLVAETIWNMGRIDNIAPIITSFGANVSTFSAIRNIDDASITITLNIHEAYKKLYVRIYDQNGVLKTTLYDQGGNAGLAMLDSWNGKSADGTYLPKGWYVMKAWGIDEAGNEEIPVQGLFEITEQHLETLNPLSLPIEYSFIASGPKSFTYSLRERTDVPNSADKPQGLRSMAVTYVAKITEKIFKTGPIGSSDALITTLGQDTQSGVFENSSIGTWDGKQNSQFVQSGTYYFLAEIRNMKGLLESTVKIPFTIDHESPVISGATVTQAPLSQLASGNKMVTVSFSISDALATNGFDMRLEFPDADLSVEKSSQSAGNNSLVMNIANAPKTIADGSRTMTLYLYDKAKNVTPLSITVVVDSTLPSFDFTVPSTNGFVSRNVTIVPGIITDATPFTVSYRSGLNGTYGSATTFDVSAIGDSTITLMMRVTDQSDNTREISKSVSVDNQIPITSFTTAPNGFTNSPTVTLSFTNTETHPYAYRIRPNTHSPWVTYPVQPTLSWALPSVDGTYDISTILEDQAGNLSPAYTRSVVLDRVAPVITSVTPKNFIANLNSVYYYSTAQIDPAIWDIAVSNEASSVSTAFKINNFSGFSEGSNTVYAQSTDKATNTSNWFGPLSIVIDTQKPVINSLSITGGNSIWQGANSSQSLIVTYTDSNFKSIQYTILQNGTPVIQTRETPASSIGFLTLVSGLGSGTYGCEVRVIDKANTMSNPSSITLFYDKTAPVITSSELSSGFVSGNTVTLSAGASDGYSGIQRIEYKIGNGNWTEKPPNGVITLSGYSDGSYSTYVRAIDTAGNFSDERFVQTLLIDRTTPTLDQPLVNAAMMNIYTLGAIRITLNSSDSGSGFSKYQYKINTGSWSDFSPALPGSTLVLDSSDPRVNQDNTYVIFIRSWDQAGNTSIEKSVTVVVDVTPPTLVAYGAGPRYAKQNVSITCNATDATSGGVSREYQFGATGTWSSLPGSGTTSLDTTSLPEGDYAMSIRAGDAAGNMTQVTVGTITIDRTAPVISMLSGFPKSDINANIAPTDTSDASLTDLARYKIQEINGLKKHTVKILGRTNQTFIPIELVVAPGKLFGNDWVVRWDGWVRSAPEQFSQVPEGPCIVTIFLEDFAGNIQSTAWKVNLEDDVLMGGTNAHTPSVQLNSGVLQVNWGEGSRQNVEVKCYTKVDRRGEITTTTKFTIDLPQLSGVWQSVDKQRVRLGNYRTIFYGPDDYSQVIWSHLMDIPFGITTDTLLPGYYELSTYLIPYNGEDAAREQTRNFAIYADGYRTRNFENGSFSSVISKSSPIPLKNAANFNSTPLLINNQWTLTFGNQSFILRSGPESTSTEALWKNPQLGTYDWASTGGPHHSSYSQKVMDILPKSKLGTPTNISVTEGEMPGLYHVSWEDNQSNSTQKQIYYQRFYTQNIYNGSLGKQLYINHVISDTASTITTLLSPKTTSTDETIMTTSRPTFTWQVPTENLNPSTAFKIQLFKGTVIGTHESLPTFNFPAGALSDQYQQIDVPAGTYTAKETLISFTPDPYNTLGKTGLSDVYRWQIGADWTGDGQIDDYSQTSEVFQVDPPLEIEAPINYPNPFKQTTKIRYKLTKDAQSVTIRIFDLAGRLVRILEDCPTNGNKPFHKYNETTWNGKNGAGDEVNNGVYIYKIIAIDETGHKVDVKGKAVKLK